MHLLKELDPDCELVAYRTSERNSKKLNELGVRTYISINEAILSEKNIDGAFITNPTSLHVKTVLQLDGKVPNIFLEKPVSHNYDKIELLNRLKSRFLVGYVLRHHPVLRKVKEIIEAGSIGNILFAEASIGQYLPQWRPSRNYRNTISAKKELGGGAVLELSHEIDYVYWLLGSPSNVFCSGGKFSDLEIDTEDIADMILSYSSGPSKKDHLRIAHIHMDFLQRKLTRNGKILGNSGDITFDIVSGRVCLNTDRGSRSYEFKTNMDDVFKDQLRHFIDVIKGNSKPAVGIKDGVNVLRIALAAKKSLESNQVINI